MKYTTYTTWFLATSLFLFGILKFINPFKYWYTIQITNSEIGQASYILGILGEITVGTILLFCLLFKSKIPIKLYNYLTLLSFVTISIIMLIAIYVHLHPKVPPTVLPLKIKEPYIPAFFFLVAVSNIYNSIKQTLK
ncbi:hypothetical protein FLCU109888_12715 [Flavobacterium cucumis]|uniref:DoxX-like family protein n=1 Tax=Flavobacterium cucumis TaxID=416016 RepID=A0A1M7ZZM8_9FLAO|nr:hypothetical protein [Flavobacterium cucumis]SHO74328.1 hypothetical protein SAMN05443547_2720 [Flavobacterium cucumis]